MVDKGDALSPEAVEEVMRRLNASPQQRLLRAVIDGNTVWIKSFDTEGLTLARRMHSWLSPLLPAAFMRASPVLDPAGLVAREARKAEAFQAAGFATPQILWRGRNALVLSQVAEIGEPLLARRRKSDPEGHDELLVSMADALGRVHAVALCHGRPHPRDMFLHGDGGGEWGFFDFEEEPEAVMPLASAQARDVWLLFMQIAFRAIDKETSARAFSAWQAQAPMQIVSELRRLVAVFSMLLPSLKALQHLHLGSDGRRLLEATSFLQSALRGQLAGHSTPDRIGTPT